MAMTAIADATGEDFDIVRAFLNSRHGRHLVDEVHNGLYGGVPLKDAIDAATQRWNGLDAGNTASRAGCRPSRAS
ncbi:hypothetical protein [Xenophilus sp. Marseille-Q4582]|uniref:hypothetical protein n=1 Tax=Xenophilus sp. Marseille-Q4582 TaxID=2866600 RepID=UPI00351D016C